MVKHRSHPSLEIRFAGPGHLELILQNAGKSYRQSITFRKNLDMVLITAIDKFLKRHRISPALLRHFPVRGTIDKNSSSYKIAKTLVSAMQEGF